MRIATFTLLRTYAPPHTAVTTTTHLLNLRRKLSLLVSNVARKPLPPHKKHTLSPKKHHLSTLSATDVDPTATPTILSPNQALGTVASAQANFMRVIVQQETSITEKFPDGCKGIELLCVVRAVLKKIGRRVLVGDRVVVGSIDWVDRRGMIEDVLGRVSEILDPPVANADHFLVVFSMQQPAIEPGSLTRFLVEAESAGMPVTLAINKCELVGEEVLVEWKSRLRGWGYLPIFCSVKSKRGLDSLAFTLRDRTTVIVGPSGVGKSSLINALRSTESAYASLEEESPSDPILNSKWSEEQRVGEVSARSGRGKHTTRNVSLLPLSGGGYLADTPGFSQPSLLKVTKHFLAQAFPEIQKKLEENKPKTCAFNNCLHVGEPGCLVTGDWERYPYYLQMLDEIKMREEFLLRTMGTKREGDVRIKVGDMGIIQAEPRLEPKKHRRTSRKKMNQSILDELDKELDDDEDEYLEDNPIIRAMEQEQEED